jgi:hypothetical protein
MLYFFQPSCNGGNGELLLLSGRFDGFYGEIGNRDLNSFYRRGSFCRCNKNPLSLTAITNAIPV